eukprot:COSAG02_NODE_29523_length_567_cov_1.852564_1_plen_90_part_00
MCLQPLLASDLGEEPVFLPCGTLGWGWSNCGDLDGWLDGRGRVAVRLWSGIGCRSVFVLLLFLGFSPDSRTLFAPKRAPVARYSLTLPC